MNLDQSPHRGSMYYWRTRTVYRGQRLAKYCYIFPEGDTAGAKKWFEMHCKNGGPYETNPRQFLTDYSRPNGEKAERSYVELALFYYEEGEFGIEVP